ncbi:MAG: hypothetical protein RBR86_01590 [Pseudobdellovibrionaceae bacterium]|nr:hypothetical protein [Pseudobdellovibrionaceae bacterium]
MSPFKSFLCLLFAISCLVSSESYAQDAQKTLSAELVMEWQNEYRAHSDDSAIDETNNSFLRAELAPTFMLSDTFFIDGVIVFEPFEQVAEVNEFDDIWFDREGILIEELKFNFESGPFAFWAGKFNPAFGSGAEAGRGIWGEDFAEDYEITEKLGVGAAYIFNAGRAGDHTLSINTFMADRSFLSGGVITARDRVSLSDGGASNTTGLQSYSVSLSGENIGKIENLVYQLGYRSLAEQSKGQDTTTDREYGWEATLSYKYPVTDALNFDMFGEYAALRNFEGLKNSDRDYYSLSAKANIYTNWNVAAAYTLRDVRDDGTGRDFHDFLFQLSGGYDFENGLTAELGWRDSREDSVDTGILGGLLRYSIDF